MRRTNPVDASGDFNTLFSLALSTLVRYDILIPESRSEFSFEELEREPGESQNEARSTISSYKSMRWRRGTRESSIFQTTTSSENRRDSNRSSSQFEIGSIRVSSMFFAEKRESLQFFSPVEFMVIRNLITSKRKRALRAIIARHRSVKVQ